MTFALGSALLLGIFSVLMAVAALYVDDAARRRNHYVRASIGGCADSTTGFIFQPGLGVPMFVGINILPIVGSAS